jgi:hypothetical protein
MTKVMDISTLTTSEIKSLLETIITDTSLNTQKIEALVKMLVNLNKRVLACENAVIVNKVSQ